MFYQSIIRKLNKAGIRYAIVGGVAANLHGHIRMTADLDIILLMRKDNIAAAVNILLRKGFNCKLPIDPMGLADPATREDWIANRNMKALNFFTALPKRSTSLSPRQPALKTIPWRYIPSGEPNIRSSPSRT